MDARDAIINLVIPRDANPNDFKEWLAGRDSGIRAAEREQCAKEIELLAFCEECHDSRDDLIRSAPY